MGLEEMECKKGNIIDPTSTYTSLEVKEEDWRPEEEMVKFR
jgi:hypothetical protein